MTNRLIREQQGTVAMETGSRGGTKVTVTIPTSPAEALSNAA